MHNRQSLNTPDALSAEILTVVSVMIARVLSFAAYTQPEYDAACHYLNGTSRMSDRSLLSQFKFSGSQWYETRTYMLRADSDHTTNLPPRSEATQG